MIKFLSLLLVSCSVVTGMGCGVFNAPQTYNSALQSSERSDSDARALALVAEDLDALKYFSASSLGLSNASAKGRFLQVFGGYSGENVKDFINERIKYFLSSNDLFFPGDVGPSKAAPSSDPKGGWTHIENFKKIEGQVAASNLGLQVWFQSLIENRPLSIVLKTFKIIPVTSSRVGVMLIGPGYNGGIRKAEDFSNSLADSSLENTTVPFPQEYRQSLLIHEARHSDCVGGLSKVDLKTAREAGSYSEFLEKFSSKKCGYLHALCLRGDYQGFPACDSMRWGSYGIQALFLEAALKEAPVGSEKWQLLLSVFIDTKSRLFFDYDFDMIQGLENPELTSLGLL
ncbi:MAG: hypothetical protein ABIQ95_00955 [Bdellovibrionia bacterium]